MMSVLNPNETTKSWKASKREQGVQLYLSGVEGDAADIVTARVAGFPLNLVILPATDSIDPADLAGAGAAVVQVDSSAAASIKRFEKLAQSTTTPLRTGLLLSSGEGGKRRNGEIPASETLVSPVLAVKRPAVTVSPRDGRAPRRRTFPAPPPCRPSRCRRR